MTLRIGGLASMTGQDGGCRKMYGWGREKRYGANGRSPSCLNFAAYRVSDSTPTDTNYTTIIFMISGEKFLGSQKVGKNYPVHATLCV